MAHEQIAVNTSTLRQDINDMDKQLSTIKKTADDMFDGIQVLNGMWEGKAHDTFLQAVKDDKNAIDELNQTIKDLLKCFDYADKQYISCDQNIRQIIRSISV